MLSTVYLIHTTDNDIMPDSSNKTTVAVAVESPDFKSVGLGLARTLDLELTSVSDTSCRFLLVVTENRLELRESGRSAVGPLFIDFVGGALGYRRVHGGGRKQPLARAMGIKGGYRPSIIDATAGLGRDSFVLASLGCRVTLIERSPVMAALVRDGIERAAQDQGTTAVAAAMYLMEGDSTSLLQDPSMAPADVVYLDPMYPHRSKSALVKKEMRLIRDLVGDDEDAPALFEASLAAATRRVVVKRPIQAPSISSSKPISMTVAGKNHRYDIYLK